MCGREHHNARRRTSVRAGRLYEALGLGAYERDRHGNTTIMPGRGWTSLLTAVRLATNGGSMGCARGHVYSVPSR